VARRGLTPGEPADLVASHTFFPITIGQVRGVVDVKAGALAQPQHEVRVGLEDVVEQRKVQEIAVHHIDRL